MSEESRPSHWLIDVQGFTKQDRHQSSRKSCWPRIPWKGWGWHHINRNREIHLGKLNICKVEWQCNIETIYVLHTSNIVNPPFQELEPVNTRHDQLWKIVNLVLFILSQLTQSSLRVVSLQEINISHLGKRKIIFKMDFSGDMLVPRRVNIDLRSTVLDFENGLLKYASNKTSTYVSAWNNKWSQTHPRPHKKNPTSPSCKKTPISYILIILPVASILKIPVFFKVGGRGISSFPPPKKEGDLRPKATTPGWNCFIVTLNLPRTPFVGPKKRRWSSLLLQLGFLTREVKTLHFGVDQTFFIPHGEQKGNQTLPCFQVDCFFLSKKEKDASNSTWSSCPLVFWRRGSI